MTRARIVVVLLLAAVILGILWSFAPERSTPQTPSPSNTPAPADVAKPASAEPDPAKPQSKAEEHSTTPVKAAKRAGEGRVFGKAESPGGGAITVRVYRVPDWTSADFDYDNVQAGEGSTTSGGQYEVAGLDLGNYVLLASAEGYTMNSQADLTPERPAAEVNLTLVPAATIAGRVVDDDRHAIPGARVFVAGWNVLSQKLDAPRERSLASQKRTDENGAFVMTNLRKTRPNDPGYKLAVTAKGYAALVTDYLPAGRDGIELVLHKGQLVSGRLVDEKSGEGLANKEIAIESQVKIDRLTAKTDGDGYFFVNDVPPGEQTARILGGELVITPQTKKVLVAEDKPTEDVLLRAAPGGKVSGRVFAAESGNGVNGVRMYAYLLSEEDPRSLQATTNAQGKYTFAGLDPGSYRIEYRKPNGFRSENSTENSERSVVAELGRETTGVDFKLTRGLTIAGIVVDESGAPVGDASVGGSAYRGNTYDYTRTAADGTFMIAGFNAGQEVGVSVRKDDYAYIESTPPHGLVKLENESVTGVRLVLGVAGSIAGTVVDARGNPKASVAMYAEESPSPFPGGSPIESSSADGTIRFENLRAGEYTINFSDLRSGVSRPSGTHVTIAKGQQIKGLRFVVPDETGLTISGRVLDNKGQGISGASIRVEGPVYRDTETDTSGAYSVSGLSAGQTFRVVAANSQYASAPPKAAVAGATGVDFTLKDHATVEGRVVDAATNKPVTAFRIRALGRSGETFFVLGDFVPISDPEGVFRLTTVDDGANRLEVRADGYADAAVPLTGVVGGQTVSDITVRIARGAELAGRVLDASGAGIGGAQLFLGTAPLDWQRERTVRATSGPDGSYRLTCLPAGSSQVTAYRANFAAKTVPVTVAPGATTQLDIVLSRGAVVEGTVHVNNEPKAGISVDVASGQASYQQLRTDENGHYHVEGLPDGAVSVMAVRERNGTSMDMKTARAQVSDGEVTTLDLNFTTGTAAIDGTVRADGQPVAEARVVARMIGADGLKQSRSAQTDASGHYGFENLFAGDYQLSVTTPGRTGKRVNVNVDDNQQVRQDIDMSGGTTLHIAVSGGYRSGTGIALLSGAIEVPAYSQTIMQTYYDDSILWTGTYDGVATISGLEPGTYTIVASSLDRSQMDSGQNFFDTARFATTIVEVGTQPQLDLSLTLESAQ